MPRGEGVVDFSKYENPQEVLADAKIIKEYAVNKGALNKKEGNQDIQGLYKFAHEKDEQAKDEIRKKIKNFNENSAGFKIPEKGDSANA